MNMNIDLQRFNDHEILLMEEFANHPLFKNIKTITWDELS